MSRSDETEYDSEVDVEGLLSDSDGTGATGDGQRERTAGATEGERTRRSSVGRSLRSRLPTLPSPSLPGPRFTARGLVLSLAVCVASFLAASVALPLGGVAGLGGVFAAGFGLGALGRGRYLELAVAGAGTAAVGTLLSQLFIAAVADLAVPVAAVGGTAGLLAAVLGCYFGRDLRAGLTRSV